MAKIATIGLTIGAVFVVAEVKVSRGERGKEARAIGALRAVSAAQRAYTALNRGYATSLNTLAAPCSAGQPGFISPDLSTDPTVTDSYEIRLHADAHAQTGPLDCHGNRTARTFYATAAPLQSSRTAMRAFAVDQNDVVWYDATGAPPKPPFSETAALKRLQ